MFRRAFSKFFAAAMTMTLLAACGDTAGPEGTARVTVALTDGPGMLIESAIVEIGEVWAIQAGGPPILLTDAGGEYDLFNLQNGVMAELATADIPASARLLQLRLHVLSASVALQEGKMFADGEVSQDLFIPSGAQSGIKINLRNAEGNVDGAGVDLVPGETILFVVDMDVEQNFVFTGSTADPQALPDVQFTPLLRATLNDVAGSISGTVSYDAAHTPDQETEYANIEAVLDLATLEVPLEEMETPTASAVANADGTYTVFFLSPGSYDVSATATIDAVEYTDGPTTIPVSAGEAVTGVDFAL